MSLSLGTRDISYLNTGQLEMTVSYRYLHSENIYIGSDEQPQIKAAGVEPRFNVNSFDLSFRYGISQRFSATATVPLIHSKASLRHPDGIRREGGLGVELGDIRLQGNFWLLDPLTHPDGNLALSFGIKVPSANEASTGIQFTPDGPVERPVDIAMQPGDGGWGIILEGQWFQRVFMNTIAYAAGFYMFNPRNSNGVEPPQSSAANRFFMSVADLYSARAGLAMPLWAGKGIALSLGGRVDGIPVTDVLGDSDGFRRPGYILYFEPGVSWSLGNNAFNFGVPIAVRRSINTSVLDASRDVRTGGGLADFLILAGYSRRF
jgi:hypothetical protein